MSIIKTAFIACEILLRTPACAVACINDLLMKFVISGVIFHTCGKVYSLLLFLGYIALVTLGAYFFFGASFISDAELILILCIASFVAFAALLVLTIKFWPKKTEAEKKEAQRKKQEREAQKKKKAEMKAEKNKAKAKKQEEKQALGDTAKELDKKN